MLNKRKLISGAALAAIGIGSLSPMIAYAQTDSGTSKTEVTKSVSKGSPSPEREAKVKEKTEGKSGMGVDAENVAKGIEGVNYMFFTENGNEYGVPLVAFASVDPYEKIPGTEDKGEFVGGIVDADGEDGAKTDRGKAIESKRDREEADAADKAAKENLEGSVAEAVAGDTKTVVSAPAMYDTYASLADTDKDWDEVGRTVYTAWLEEVNSHGGGWNGGSDELRMMNDALNNDDRIGFMNAYQLYLYKYSKDIDSRFGKVDEDGVRPEKDKPGTVSQMADAYTDTAKKNMSWAKDKAQDYLGNFKDKSSESFAYLSDLASGGDNSKDVKEKNKKERDKQAQERAVKKQLEMQKVIDDSLGKQNLTVKVKPSQYINPLGADSDKLVEDYIDGKRDSSVEDGGELKEAIVVEAKHFEI